VTLTGSPGIAPTGIAGRPAIAFGTAALEQALPAVKEPPDVEETPRAMLDELGCSALRSKGRRDAPKEFRSVATSATCMSTSAESDGLPGRLEHAC
jgi:hypothetical protein